MDVNEIFKPSAETEEAMNALLETLENTCETTTDDDFRKEDCTGCWGGTCANGITG